MLENITTRATVLESLGVGENSTIELVGNTYDWNITELEYPRYLRGIGTFLCVLLLVVGLIGNTIVPIVVLYNRCLRNSTHFFLINLSVADLLVLLFCIPTALVELNSIPEVWTLGKFLCKASSLIEFLVAHGSILTILAISFERYYAICRPLQAVYRCTRRRAVMVIIGIWILSFLTSLPMNWITILQESTLSDGQVVDICFNRLDASWIVFFFLAIFFIFFWIPFFILIYLFIEIHNQLSSTLTRDMISSGLSPRRNRTRKQVVRMLMAVWIMFFVCLLPYRILGTWVIFARPEQIQSLGRDMYNYITYSCRILLYVNSTTNPIIYNVVSSRFRHGLMRAFGPKHWLHDRTRISSSSRAHSWDHRQDDMNSTNICDNHSF